MASGHGRMVRPPRSIVIAGPNGAGKTTFAREFLPREAGVIHFVNADLIASGLSPLRPELAVRSGGRLLLKELARLANARKDFAFETTLSGRTYLRLLQRWKASGYRIQIVFLCASPHGFDKVATTFHGQTSYDGSIEAGRIFKFSTEAWQIPGRFTIMQEQLPAYWRKVHERFQGQVRSNRFCS